MLITDVRKSGSPGGAQKLTAAVSWTTPIPRDFDLYFRFENAPGEIGASADPFLVSFLIAAMILGEDLEVRGPVDPELVGRIEKDIIPLLRRWFPSLHAIELKCPDLQAPPSRTADAGGVTGFSGGLDALYTTVRHRERLNWLLAAQGFDIRDFQTLEWRKVFGDITVAAAPFGRPLIEASTNVREIGHYQVLRPFDGNIHPDVYRIGPNGPIAPFMVALARCMMPFCSRFLISSTEPYELLYPYGSHPLLDPMFSTSQQDIQHIGCEFGRIEKLEYLKEACPECLQHLRVCWRASPRKPNCGRCEKCLRTLAEARLAGAEALIDSFDAPIDFNEMKLLTPGQIQMPYWEELATRAAAQGDHEIARAAEVVLGRRLHLPRLKRRLFSRRRSRSHPRFEWRRLRRVMEPPRENNGGRKAS